MGRNRAVKGWLKRVVTLVVVVELAWLVVVNFLLFLPFTQTAINAIRPEKFNIRWERAWSWYPGRVSVWNASANGNSRSQMWQVDVDAVSGSISLLPLILKRVNVDGVTGADISFRLRPRLKPDRDYSRIEEWFPPIDGRVVTPAVTTPYKSKRPWRVAVGDMRVEGPLDYWIYHVRGRSDGFAEGGLNYVTRGGEFDLDVRAFDLGLGPHSVGDETMFNDGSLAGSMGFAPFVPRENKGLPMLGFLRLDAEVDIDANDLRFVRLFVLNFQNITVDGEGTVITTESCFLNPNRNPGRSSPTGAGCVGNALPGTAHWPQCVSPSQGDSGAACLSSGQQSCPCSASAVSGACVDVAAASIGHAPADTGKAAISSARRTASQFIA